MTKYKSYSRTEADLHNDADTVTAVQKEFARRDDTTKEQTRVEGFWGAMIPTSYGKIIKRENGKITIKWDDDNALFYALEKDLRVKGDDQVSPIGVFIDVDFGIPTFLRVGHPDREEAIAKGKARPAGEVAA